MYTNEILGVVLITLGVALALLRHEVSARLNAVTHKKSDTNQARRPNSFHLSGGIEPGACIGLGALLVLLGVMMVLFL